MLQGLPDMMPPPPPPTHSHSLPLVINCHLLFFFHKMATQKHTHTKSPVTRDRVSVVLFYFWHAFVTFWHLGNLELHLDIMPWVAKSQRSHPTVFQSQCSTTVVSDSNKDGTGTQWDRSTYRQAHNGTVTQWDRHTVIETKVLL